MEILTDRSSLMQWTEHVHSRGDRMGFVPTMGALHSGHLALVETAKQHNSQVVASIFVNPAQFGPNEDFNRYPRVLETDRKLLIEAGCQALFYPSLSEIYPDGFQTVVKVDPLGQDLCGRFRPHHFQGVATVVALLFNLVRPDQAFFGWKDYQQVIVIRKMVEDMAMKVQVVGVPIVREVDGLALSSRNRYLTPKDRKQSVALYHALLKAKEVRKKGEVLALTLEQLAEKVLNEYGIHHVDYVAVRDAQTLKPLKTIESDPVMLIAAHVGSTRLIDNMILSSE